MRGYLVISGVVVGALVVGVGGGRGDEGAGQDQQEQHSD